MFKKKYTLLRSQKKKVFEILQEAGLEPAEFSWGKEEIAGSVIVSKLSYRDGTWYFQFCSYELNAWCVAAPGVYRSVDYEYPKNWEEQEEVLDIMDLLDTPDFPDKDALFCRFGHLMKKADSWNLIPHEGTSVKCSFEIFRKIWGEASELRSNGKLLQRAV